MSYQGAYASGDTIYWLFLTAVDGVPTVFSGSPAISVYKNSTTQSTAGVSLTVSYDGVVGQNQILIDTSADATFYASGNQFSVVVSAGTVGGDNVIGWPVGYFTLDTETVSTVTGSVGSVIGGVGGSIQGGVVSGRPRQYTAGTRS